MDEVSATYRLWADNNGHTKLSKATFGGDLRAVCPHIGTTRPRESWWKASCLQGDWVAPCQARITVPRCMDRLDRFGDPSPDWSRRSMDRHIVRGIRLASAGAGFVLNGAAPAYLDRPCRGRK